MADDFPGVFPGALDSYTTLIDNTDNIAANHPNARGSAIAKIEAKVGVTGSAVVTAHDYLLTHLPGQAANWDAGAVEIRAETFESDVATGTAPMTIASTTKVTNLNADTVDGVSSAAIIQTTGAQSIAGVKTFTTAPVFPVNTVKTADIQDDAITTAKILNVNVTAGKLATDAVETLKIKALNVTAAKLATDSVETAKIKNSNVTTAKIADNNVTSAKLEDDLAFGTFPTTPASAPDADYEVANKKYVDDNGLADASVSQAKLKTSTGTVRITDQEHPYDYQISANRIGTDSYVTNIGVRYGASFASSSNIALPGGEYGFYPQIKGSADCDAQQRYITASGKDHWIFLLVNKVTGKINSAFEAPDHPCYGNVADEVEMPHPFLSMDEATQEVVLVDNDILNELKSQITRRKGLLDIILEDCEIDDITEATYEEREIIEIDEYGNLAGEVIAEFDTPDWAKIKIKGDKTTLKKRMVNTIPSNIKYKKMKLKK